MTGSLVIDIPTLRQAINSLLDHVEDSNGSELTLSHDFFWTVPDVQRYDNYDRPSELTIGQLSESWQWLIDSAGSATQVSRNVMWAADVLAAIATEAKP